MSDARVSHAELNAILFSNNNLDNILSSNLDAFADLGFNILDSNEDPALLQYTKKHDELKVRDKFSSLRDFKDAVIDLAISQH
jgi:hypothetical protein